MNGSAKMFIWSKVDQWRTYHQWYSSPCSEFHVHVLEHWHRLNNNSLFPGQTGPPLLDTVGVLQKFLKGRIVGGRDLVAVDLSALRLNLFDDVHVPLLQFRFYFMQQSLYLLLTPTSLHRFDLRRSIGAVDLGSSSNTIRRREPFIRNGYKFSKTLKRMKKQS